MAAHSGSPEARFSVSVNPCLQAQKSPGSGVITMDPSSSVLGVSVNTALLSIHQSKQMVSEGSEYHTPQRG